MQTFPDLISLAAGGFDYAVVRLVQGLSRGAGRGPDFQERLRRLQLAARAYRDIDPAAFFAPPPALQPLRAQHVRDLPGGEVVDLAWQSGFTPHEPQLRSDYLAFEENRIAHARLLRHAEPRPAIVCLHGYGAGIHRFEELAWNARWLYRKGLDVALLTLPFHALRAPRFRKAPAFPSASIGRTIEGFGQAVWDVRSLLNWLRSRGSPLAGLAGMSLGGYTAALTATVEARLDYAVLFIPLGDLTDVTVEHEALRGQHVPPYLIQAGKEALSLVRPLARTPLVPGDRMLVAAARADRITPAEAHAHKLAEHFRAPMVTFAGSHLVQVGRATAFAQMARLLARQGALRPR